MKNKILMVIMTIFLLSCATTSSHNDKIAMNELELSMGVENSDMLFSLFSTEIVKSSTKTSSTDYTNKVQTTTTTTSTTKTPKHPFGVYIGNDLFVDLNGNISLSILNHYKLRHKESWEVEFREFGSMQKSLANKNGNVITYKGLGENAKEHTRVEYSENSIYKKSGLLEENIVKSQDGYDYSSNMSLLLKKASLKQIEDNQIDLNGTIVTLENGEVLFKSKLTGSVKSRITNNNGVIEVYKTIYRFIFFKDEKLVATIYKTPDSINVKENLSFGLVNKKKFAYDENRISIKPSFIEFYYNIN